MRCGKSLDANLLPTPSGRKTFRIPRAAFLTSKVLTWKLQVLPMSANEVESVLPKQLRGIKWDIISENKTHLRNMIVAI